MGQPAPKPQVSGRANLVNLELALHPVSWSLPYWDSAGILGPSRDPGTGQGSWDLAGILGPDRDPGTCRDPGTWQESWDWTGILGLDRDLFQGGAGKRQSWYLVFNVLIVAKKLLKDDRWVPGVVLVVDAAAVSL